MKVICHINYSAEYEGTLGKVLVSFEKGKIYNYFTEYDDCYIFSINLDFFFIKKDYFLTLDQVKKRRLLSFNKKRFLL